MRLSQVELDVGQLDAIFFTHMHSDHTDGFADLMQARWNWNSTGPKLEVVCSADVPSPLDFIMSCPTSGMPSLSQVRSRNASPRTNAGLLAGPPSLVI